MKAVQTLVFTSLCAMAGIAAAATDSMHAAKMTHAERSAAKNQIDADEKTAKAACKKLSGAEKSACKKEASAKEKMAKAELKAKN